MAKHECGHTFAWLTDEYYTWYGVTTGINATDTTNNIPWKIWIAPEIPLPTPDEEKYHNVVGLFPFYWLPPEKHGYKPQWDCIMGGAAVDMNQHAFCVVCREAHVLRLYELLPVIANYAPRERNILFNEGENKSFSIELPYKPKTHGLEILWDLDGENVGTGTTSVTISCSKLKNDFSKLTVTITDATAWVRTRATISVAYPYYTLSKQWHWNLLPPREYPRVDVWGEWWSAAEVYWLKLHYQCFRGSNEMLNYGDGYVAVMTESGKLIFMSHELNGAQNKFTTKADYFAKGLRVSDMSGLIGNAFYRPYLERGVYRVYSVITKPGGNPLKAGDRLSSVGSSNFGFALDYLPPYDETLPW